jgi:hypothetical protein
VIELIRLAGLVSDKKARHNAGLDPCSNQIVLADQKLSA